jgi:hypothetical protein
VRLVDQTAVAEASSAGWKSLFKVGGAGAIAIVVLYCIEVVGFVAMGPPPATVDAWFTLFRDHGLLGLLDAYLLDAVAVTLMAPLFLALYAALGQAKRAYVTLATALAFVGIAVYLATNVTFSMFYLSGQYAAATTDAQRSLFMAAGQAMFSMSIEHGFAPYVALLLIGVAGLIASVLMLGNNTFTKRTAYVGILANAFQVAEPPVIVVPANFYQNIGLFLILMSFVFYVIWYLLIARRLLQLGSGIREGEAH